MNENMQASPVLLLNTTAGTADHFAIAAIHKRRHAQTHRAAKDALTKWYSVLFLSIPIPSSQARLGLATYEVVGSWRSKMETDGVEGAQRPASSAGRGSYSVRSRHVANVTAASRLPLFDNRDFLFHFCNFIHVSPIVLHKLNYACT